MFRTTLDVVSAPADVVSCWVGVGVEVGIVDVEVASTPTDVVAWGVDVGDASAVVEAGSGSGSTSVVVVAAPSRRNTASKGMVMGDITTELKNHKHPTFLELG
jgi:hypothetical protein